MNVFFYRNGGVALSIRGIFSNRLLASVAKNETKEKDDLDITSLEEQPVFTDSPIGLSEEEIEAKRNKSRLGSGDRNALHNIVPQNEIIHRYQNTVKYKRRQFGRYGMQACDAPIGIAWPTKEEIEDAKEYESVLNPESIQQMWDKIAEKKSQDAAVTRNRDETIAKNLVKMEKWTSELNARIAKKENEAREARERKERLMEEVRRHFGFKISPKDERFKEMLAQKDKAEKKAKKAAKKQARDQQMMAMFAEKAASLPKKQAETEDSKSSDNA